MQEFENTTVNRTSELFVVESCAFYGVCFAMGQLEPDHRIVRFGSFEVDLREGKLTKGGIRIKLQGQPFQILALLLERPGQLVTRDEIRQKLWSQDTFVEFDDGLNTAVRKLRAALGDPAENPRFVETVPRRGYRFVAPVTLPLSPHAAAAPSQTNAGPLSDRGMGVSSVRQFHAQSVPTKPKPRAMRSAVLAFAALLVIAAAGTYWYLRRPAFHVTSKDTIVLADFVNTTGDIVFDDALKQGLEVSLVQSPSLNILSDRKVAAILKQMGHAADDRLTGKMAIELCQRVGSKVAVQGSISSLGTTYLISLGAIRCDNGDPVALEQVEAHRKEDVVDALGSAATRLRARLGESMPSIQKYNAPLEQATTGSLEALKAYSMALSTWDRKGDQASIPFFEKAIEIDPNFAMAYGGLGTIYHNRNEVDLARVNATKAYGLRERVTEAEKVAIESRYFLYVTGDLEKAAQVYELAVQNYPQSAGAFNHLGTTYAELGHYEKAVDSLREAIRLDPTRATTYSNLAADLLAQNRVEEAAAVLGEADRRNFQTDYLLQVKYWRAFLRGDSGEMQRILQGSSDVPGAQSLLLTEQANTEAYYGRFQKARELSRVAAEQLEHDGFLESAADCLAVAAVREAEIGAAARAHDYISRAFKLAHGRDVLALTALVTASVGDAKQAEIQSAALDKQYPSDTVMQQYWLPTIRAQMDLRQGKPLKAVEALKAAVSIEVAAPTFSVATLYPAYVRGQAYLAAGEAARAIAEFQKLVDHSGLVLNFPLATLARLELARAYTRAGDSARARQSYQDFLQLWKDADPDVAILKQARLEYAALLRQSKS